MPCLFAQFPTGNPGATAGLWAATPGVSDVALWLSCLPLAVLLWRQRGALPARFRSSVALLAILVAAFGAAHAAAVLTGAGSWVTWVAAVVVAGATLVLLRLLSRAAVLEQQARDAEVAQLELLAAAVGASSDGVVIAEGGRGPVGTLRIVYANTAFEALTGYSPEEALGLSPSVLADGTEPGSLELLRDALRGGRHARVEVAGRRKDGTRVCAEWQVVPVTGRNGGPTQAVAVIRDTTERRRSEQALRESEARFRGLFEHAADAIFLLEDGRIADANRRACQTLGYDREQLVSLRFADLEGEVRLSGTDPTETLTTEQWYRRKDGTSFPVEVRFAGLEAGGRRLKLAIVRDVTRRRQAEQALREREELLRNVISHIPCGVFWKDRDSVYLGCNDQVARDRGLAGPRQVVGRTDFDLGVTTEEANHYRECDRRVMESGEPIVNREETRTRPDGTRATLLTSKVPLLDAAGTIVGVVGVYQDMTDRKRLEEQLWQAQKLDAVGRLAGGIAHDFNNLLTIIRGNADLLSEPDQTGLNPMDLLADVRMAADRATALVRQLLVFSRRQHVRPEVVDLGQIVTATSGMLRRLLGERVVVETRLHPGPVTIRADRSHLEQVLMNLCVNARDAMPDGGTLTIGTEVVAGGTFARLTVSDTGLGMDEGVRSKVFEPFFTTKGPDKGTGLGLATVFGIVQQAGGRIDVESEPGRGTTFRVDLPWWAGPADPHTPTPAPLSRSLAARSAQRPPGVLVVEDEDAVRKITRVTLEGGGYAVTDAPDGETALRLLDPERIDVLVTDVVMPGIDGRELAERVRAAHPNVGVVFVSGYFPDSGRLDGIPGAVFLPKPFTAADLLRAAGRVLRKSGSRTWTVPTELAAAPAVAEAPPTQPL